MPLLADPSNLLAGSDTYRHRVAVSVDRRRVAWHGVSVTGEPRRIGVVLFADVEVLDAVGPPKPLATASAAMGAPG